VEEVSEGGGRERGAVRVSLWSVGGRFHPQDPLFWPRFPASRPARAPLHRWGCNLQAKRGAGRARGRAHLSAHARFSARLLRRRRTAFFFASVFLSCPLSLSLFLTCTPRGGLTGSLQARRGSRRGGCGREEKRGEHKESATMRRGGQGRARSPLVLSLSLHLAAPRPPVTGRATAPGARRAKAMAEACVSVSEWCAEGARGLERRSEACFYSQPRALSLSILLSLSPAPTGRLLSLSRCAPHPSTPPRRRAARAAPLVSVTSSTPSYAKSSTARTTFPYPSKAAAGVGGRFPAPRAAFRAAPRDRRARETVV